MLDLLADLIKPDEFLLALAGHVANEGVAKLTVSAVKAFGLAVLGVAFEAVERRASAAKKSANRRRQKPKRRPFTKRTKGRRRRNLT